MERKKELKLHYKETNKVEAGIYKIENIQTGKMLIASTRNFKTLNGVRFTLANNTHIHKSLQLDWNTFGADNFIIEPIETLNKVKSPLPEKEALAALEEKWNTHYKEQLYG